MDCPVDPCRSRTGLHLGGAGPVGVHERRHARLVQARQADGQFIHRVIQRQGPGRVRRPELVRFTGGCADKM